MHHLILEFARFEPFPGIARIIYFKRFVITLASVFIYQFMIWMADHIGNITNTRFSTVWFCTRFDRCLLERYMGRAAFLTVCFFYGCSCLRSSIEPLMERAWVQWQFSSGACQGVFFVVIETLWVLCNCSMTHSLLCVSWRLVSQHFQLTVLRWSLLVSSCEFLLLGIACYQALFVSCE